MFLPLSHCHAGRCTLAAAKLQLLKWSSSYPPGQKYPPAFCFTLPKKPSKFMVSPQEKIIPSNGSKKGVKDDACTFWTSRKASIENTIGDAQLQFCLCATNNLIVGPEEQ